MYTTIILVSAFAAIIALPQDHVLQWKEFKLTHNKNYGQEESFRFHIFLDNLKKIEDHNTLFKVGKKTYKMGVTKFADMTSDEFKKYLTLFGKAYQLDSSLETFRVPKGINPPDSVDYRKQKAVNPIKDQGNCGSCWAFSAVGALESVYFLNSGVLYSLSEQNLMDCSHSYGNYGCDGGLMETSFHYIKDYGIETEKDYPYEALNDDCFFNKSKSVLSLKAYKVVEPGNESALQAAVATVGPIAVAVDASEWQLYTSGIFETNGYGPLNHGVVTIGYGSENDTEYWIVRNSWGTSWGEDGYIRVARNHRNQVGISDDASFPII